MRESIIKALSYPRELVRGEFELDDCPHSGLYAEEDARCIDCPQRPECEWLYSNEEFVALEQKPMAEILEALEFALEYVAAQIAYWQHDSQQCGCTSCSWLKDAARLFDEVRTAALGRA